MIVKARRRSESAFIKSMAPFEERRNCYSNLSNFLDSSKRIFAGLIKLEREPVNA